MEYKKTSKKLNNAGTTLVELITTFALIGLFMVAAMKVISNTVVIYHDAKAITSCMQVSGIVTAKVRGEIEGALTNYMTDETSANKEEILPYAVLIMDEGHAIELTDHTGCHIRIDVNDAGLLNIHYYSIISIEGGREVIIPETDWTYDAKAYMGYRISNLTFEQPKQEHDNNGNPTALYADNIIKMTLTLDSPKYGDYTVSEYIECYNFDESTFSRIGSE